MAYTIDQYGALTASIVQGATSVKYADKEVTYRSLDDMIRIQRMMEVQLFPTKRPATRRYFVFSKGINPVHIPSAPEGSVYDAAGLILTAPNGTRMRVTANDDGSLSTTVI